MSHPIASEESLGQISSNSSTCTCGYSSQEEFNANGNGNNYQSSSKCRDYVDASPASANQQCYGNSYFNFLKDCSQKYRSMYNGHRVVNVGSQQWRAMSPHSRSQYRNTDNAMLEDLSSEYDDLVVCSDAIAIDSHHSSAEGEACGKSKKRRKTPIGKAKGKKSLCSKTKKRSKRGKKRSSMPKKGCSKPKSRRSKARKATKKCAKPKKPCQ